MDVSLLNSFHLYLQIPEEEKNLGPHDCLIHVYHFMNEENQNQVVISLTLCIWLKFVYVWDNDPSRCTSSFCFLFIITLFHFILPENSELW